MASVPIYSEDTSMALFRQAMPFGPGSGAIADRLCAIGRYRSLSSGEELPDDVMEDRLVFIAHGEAKLLAFAHPFGQGHIGSAKPDDPARHVLAFHFAGDIVSVLRQANAGFCLTALSDLDLVEFSARKFLDIAQDDPAILRSVLVNSLQALEQARTRMMQLGHQSARQRIAGFLVSMAERICGCTRGSCEFSLPMARADIGDSLGLTIETVSRQFTDLRHDGLVTTRGRSAVTLVDIEALRREAGP